MGHQLQPLPSRLLAPLISYANRSPRFARSSLLIQASCLGHLYPPQVNPAPFPCCSTCHPAHHTQQCSSANPVSSALWPCLVNPIVKNCTQGFAKISLALPPPPVWFQFNGLGAEHSIWLWASVLQKQSVKALSYTGLPVLSGIPALQSAEFTQCHCKKQQLNPPLFKHSPCIQDLKVAE